MKIIQINLNHCEAAQDLLAQTISEMEADVAIVSEPFKVPKNNLWAIDASGTAAIWACGKYPFQDGSNKQQKDGFVIAKINGINIFSCYAPPSLSFGDFEELLDNVVSQARGRHPFVIAGDFNAWAEEWGSRYTNSRGRTLLEAFCPLDITLANKGSTSTFRKNGYHSVIDVTFVSSRIAKQNMNWRVSEHYTHSDHQALIYDICDVNKAKSSLRKCTRKGWLTKAFDEELFCELLRDTTLPAGGAEIKVNHVMKQITNACDASMPKRRSTDRGKPVYWWNDKIKDLRTKCLRARRRSQRSATSRDGVDKIEYKRLRRELRDEIRKNKRESFKKLCEEADANPWGSAYRIVMTRLKGQRSPPERCPIVLHKIVSTLFPQHSPRSGPRVVLNVNEEIPMVTVEEILDMICKIGDTKASGPDEIPNKAIKAALKSSPSMIAELMQACLEEGTFPRRWKMQRLVLIPKPGKLPGEPSSYRPICLLDTMGKILERVVQLRLQVVAEGENGLSNHQYGFRKALSTLDAIWTVVSIIIDAIQGKRWKGGTKKYGLVVTLDVKNAFNTANWGNVMKALGKMNVPSYLLRLLDSYFDDRILEYDSEDGPKYYNVTAGVPQGSVLGPVLWNIMYNDVLNLRLPDGATVVGFADDIAVVVTAKHIDEVECIANEAVLEIRKWLYSVGLELAEHKTEAVLISSRKKIEKASIRVGNEVIQSKEAIKYLGIMLDHRLNFKSHVKYACAKASVAHSALANMLPNIGGPRSSRRLLLASVVKSITLYGSPIWAKALETVENQNQLNSVQRLSALRVISAYRTTSGEAALVIAGMMPFTILAEEARSIFENKRNLTDQEDINRIRAESMSKWQERWTASDKGRWTYRLIPNIAKWVQRDHGEVNYDLTQFLTGHGGYRCYLHRFGNDDTPYCPTCVKVVEDPEHAVFYCPRFETVRIAMGRSSRVLLSPDNIVEEMLRSQEIWDDVCGGISKIQRELRRLEAARKYSMERV